MAVQSAQVAAPILLLVGTFLLGMVPALLVRRLTMAPWGSKALSFLVCLGGGVIFATSFLHMLPEVREGFEKVHTEFPVTEGVVCLGFLAVYVLEEMIHSCLGHSHSSASHGHSHSPAVIGCSHDDREHAGQQHPWESSEVVGGAKPEVTAGGATVAEEQVPLNQVTTAGVLIVAALSFHSLFEGLSLGLQESNQATWLMFLAISIHKFVLAFVIGFDLSAGKVKPRSLAIYMGIFAIMSPLGAIVGAITRHNLEGSLVVVSLNGIAAGTLIYVTFFEVMQRQKNDHLSGMVQLIAVLLGFGLMLIVIIFLPV